MDENPYLGIVGRRVRNLKKRLAKVTEWEKLVGTTLNAEQREAVASKSSIERSIADMDAIMEQMLVAAQEQASSATKCSAASAQVTSALTEEVVIAAAQKLSNMSIEPPLPVPVPVVENANASAKQTVSVGVSTFQTPSDERTSAISVPEPAHTEDLKQEMGELLMKLLRGLHVCARYTATTGKKLPDELDYFGEVVLGQTVTLGTDFTSNLAQSVRQAGFFLYVRFNIAFFLLNSPCIFSLYDPGLECPASRLASANP